MLQELKNELAGINNELADLDAKISDGATDRELNEIGAKIIYLEEKLGAFLQAVELSGLLQRKIEQMKNKFRL